jgi:hypothetical protein
VLLIRTIQIAIELLILGRVQREIGTLIGMESVRRKGEEMLWMVGMRVLIRMVER